MLQKRISKPPKIYVSPVSLPIRKKKKKVIQPVKPPLDGPRCQYQMIPGPTKFLYNSNVYHLCGVTPFMKIHIS